jgi:GH35 family endo-1,4-beta-xylanase
MNKMPEEEAVRQAEDAIATLRQSEVTLLVRDQAGRPLAGVSVAATLVRHDFLFGCNLYKFKRYPAAGKNEAYQRRFAELFNAATLPFYWRSYEPERGKPDYAYTDQAVAWCREHGIRMKGHPLLWNTESGRPVWMNGRQPPVALQKQRVTEIIRRYRGKIGFWEVVNEPSHCRGLKIDQPYRWAHKADPGAYLIVNDYHVLADGWPPFFRLLKQAIRSGVPFDGIGIQAHEPRTTRFPLSQVRRILDRYAALGKELHITEFTPTSSGQPIVSPDLKGVWDEAAQADYATKFYTVCFAHPAVAAITWWDLCDDGAWLAGGGMLRQDLSPKPVYTALKEIIKKRWTTRARGRTDSNGCFSFRGFRGEYMVRIRHNGRISEQLFHLARQTGKTVDFALTPS